MHRCNWFFFPPLKHTRIFETFPSISKKKANSKVMLLCIKITKCHFESFLHAIGTIQVWISTSLSAVLISTDAFSQPKCSMYVFNQNHVNTAETRIDCFTMRQSDHCRCRPMIGSHLKLMKWQSKQSLQIRREKNVHRKELQQYSANTEKETNAIHWQNSILPFYLEYSNSCDHSEFFVDLVKLVSTVRLNLVNQMLARKLSGILWWNWKLEDF